MKTNLLKLRRAFSYVLCVLLTGSLAIAKANPQSNNQILNETFESYTVGNKIASEANLAGNNWWTTWSEDPGSTEDGVVAEYGGTKCGYYTQGNDQVLILNENNDGIYNLEFDMLIPEGKKGYFNILHDFAGAQGSQWAFAAFINMDNNGNFTEGEGTFFIDGATLNQNVFVFDEWMHFRFNISTDNDLAHLYYSTETTYQEEQLLFYWQWSHDTNGNSCGEQLDAVNFYGGYSDVHFYIDNISLGLVASAFVVDGIKYLINDDGTSVTVKGLADGVNASGDLNIPATVTFNEIVYNVTKIADYAFDGEYGFSGTLTIPAYITNIGRRAFRDCSGFTTLNYNAINCSFGNSVFEDNQISTLNIGNGVEVLPSMGLSGLTGTLTMPNSVTYIGEAAFRDCSGLTGNLIIPSSVTSIDAEAFRGTGFNGTLTIPEGVTSIGRRAFNETGFTTINYNAINCVMGAQFDELENTYTYECVFEWCQNLETLNIGENVQTISPYAFCVDGFTGDLIIPNSVTTIGASAFNNTNFNGTLTIPENVTTIGSNAFYRTQFTTINYNAINCVMGEGVDWYNNPSYECVFSQCEYLETLYIGENVQTISPSAFNVDGFTGDLVIPNSVITIGANAFSETNFDGTLTIPENVTTIGKGAFYRTQFTTINYNAINCVMGEGVDWENNISYECVFNNCYYLETLNLGENVQIIPTRAFNVEGFSSTLVIPNSVTTIGDYAFSGTGFTGDLVIPNSVTTIGTSAFYNAGFNGALTIPENIATIGREAFRETGFITINYNAINCVMGEGVDWENNVSYECVFGGCQNLETLNIGENVQTISPYAFCVDGFTGDLIIPNSVTTIGASAFNNTNFNGTLTIPENVTTIGSNAFYRTQFTTINYNAINCVMGEGVDWENNVSYECVFGGCQNLETLNIGENVQTISPYAFCVDGFTGDLIIPNSVTTIGASAFNNTNFNGTLTIPENVTTIGSNAFYRTQFTTINYNAINCVMGEGVDWYDNPSYECVFSQCEYLETLYIGENVQTISPSAFNVDGFTGDLVIPNSVITIGANAFSETNFDGTLTIPENVTTIGRGAFYRTQFTTINYNAINCVMGEGLDWGNNVSYECVFGWCQNLETLNIGENVQTISPSAFNVDGFTGDLVIPSSVTAIGANAFAETGFNGIMTMSNAVTSIGAYAFYNTQFSGTLTIPSSVTHIGSGAFYGTGFTTLNYNIPNYDEEITSSYDGPFSGMNSLTTLNIGNNVEVIPNNIFGQMTALTGELIIPNSVTYIGNSAFAGDGFNGSLVIPNSVTYIGSNAFDATDFDGTLTIGNSVTSIGEHAFGGVGFTGNLVIPNSVQTIANGAFADCGFDGTLTLGNSVTSIGEYAFGSVSFTGDLVIPNSVLTIGEEAFVGCEGFTGNLTIGNAVTSIGNSAFSNCYGFSGSLILGNSVETIGNRAFYGCGGFHGELTLPETVTYIGDGAFRSCDELTKVNYNATNCTYMGNSNSPVFYDCVSISQINIGENVESIPNYAFKRCSNVTAMNVAAGVPPTIGSSTFGTVSRSIPVSVPYGTREAYRTAPYWSEFLNIHDDYTPTQYDYYWTVDVNQFSSDMTIIGVIQINGVEQENPALEIGAFCGTECRGRQMLTYYSQIDRYQVLLMLYGEDGDVFSFRLYNHENEEELLLGSENEVTFVTNATLGLPLDPYVFNFVSKQTTALNSGWSWYSTYIEQGGIDGLEMIENSLGEAGLMIQSRNNGYVEAFDYNNSVVWYGTLNAIENEQMYKVHTNASCNVVMTGVSATMSNHPITINSGWNWIGFPSGRNLNLNTALSGMTPEINDIIKGRNGYATYVSYNENNTWYGTLNVLESGQGYMYLSNSETPKTLVYQTGRDAELFNNITADGNIYKPVSERFADNMTITAIVDMDDVELKSESYEIAAFVGDECRGSVKLMYVEPFDRYVAFLTVFGEQSEEMRFVLTNNNDVFSSTEHISFINDGVVGTLTEPAIIHFGTMNLVDENNQTVSVYPNPTNGVFNVYCNGIKRIEVINTVGQLVKDMNVSDDSVAIDLSNEKAGVYMLRVITDNEIIVKRVIKE